MRVAADLESVREIRCERGVFSVEDVVCVCALHRRQVTRGEELSVVHRVGPWLPVIPVDLVPAMAGGDIRGLLRAQPGDRRVQ
jgi:hypothetical protein